MLASAPSDHLQELLQEFSWTQAAMPADLERRNQRLLASEADLSPPQQASRGRVRPSRHRGCRGAGAAQRMRPDSCLLDHRMKPDRPQWLVLSLPAVSP